MKTRPRTVLALNDQGLVWLWSIGWQPRVLLDPKTTWSKMQ